MKKRVFYIDSFYMSTLVAEGTTCFLLFSSLLKLICTKEHGSRRYACWVKFLLSLNMELCFCWGSLHDRVVRLSIELSFNYTLKREFWLKFFLVIVILTLNLLLYTKEISLFHQNFKFMSDY